MRDEQESQATVLRAGAPLKPALEPQTRDARSEELLLAARHIIIGIPPPCVLKYSTMFTHVRSRTRQDVPHLVNEDDGRCVLACKVEQLGHQLLALPQPLRHQVLGIQKCGGKKVARTMCCATQKCEMQTREVWLTWKAW